MNATIRETLAAFKVLLAGLEGAEIYDHVPDDPVLPAVMMHVERWPYNLTESKTVILWCVTGMVDSADAQVRMGEWLSEKGTNSIIDLIDSDNRLGGVVSSVLPVEARNIYPTQTQEGRPRLMQAELVCEIFP